MKYIAPHCVKYIAPDPSIRFYFAPTTHHPPVNFRCASHSSCLGARVHSSGVVSIAWSLVVSTYRRIEKEQAKSASMSTAQGPAVPPAGGDGNGNGKKNKNRSRGGKFKKNKGPSKPKMTKEERRAKYTKIAHDRRDRKIASARSKNLVCFRCRKKGHAAADCTTDLGDGSEAPGGDNLTARAGRGGGKHCYKCGSTEHGLSQCSKMKNAPRLASGKIDFTKVELPHATCYICNTMGHLASSCDKNEGRGIFIKGGGGCRVCGSVQHIASDCPDNDKKRKKRRGDDNSDDDVDVDDDGAAVVDDFLEEENGKEERRKKKAKTARKRDDDEGNGNGDDGADAILKPEAPKMKKRKKKVVNF